jgi:hypothetical protein
VDYFSEGASLQGRQKSEDLKDLKDLSPHDYD